MRTGIREKVLATALGGLLLAGNAPVAVAAEFGYPTAASTGVAQAWICRYTVEADDAWYMHCQDMVSIQNDDPVLNDDPASALLIPLWSAPFDDSRPPELARAVLCAAGSRCTIAINSL